MQAVSELDQVKSIGGVFVAILCALLSPVTHAAATEPQNGSEAVAEPRLWKPEDSVAIRYFETEQPLLSADGRKLFFIATWGDLSCDCNFYELTVYETQKIRASLLGYASRRLVAPAPLRTLVRRSTNHHGSEFANARWEPDGETIGFEGSNDRGVRQVYLLKVRTGEVVELTHWPGGVRDAHRKGDTVISNMVVPIDDPPPSYPVNVVTKTELLDMLFPKRISDTFVAYKDGSPWRLKSTHAASAYTEPAFSEDGRRAIVVSRPKEVPDGWSRYDRLPTRVDSGRVEPDEAPRFMFIDAEHGLDRPVFDAPVGTATSVGYEMSRTRPLPLRPAALWAKGSIHVVLTNSALPLAGKEDSELARMAYVVDYNANTGQWSVIEPLQTVDQGSGALRRVTAVGWLRQGSELLVRHAVGGMAAAGTVYALDKEDRWVGHSVESSVDFPASSAPHSLGGLSIHVHQSDNEPPVMVASDGRRELPLSGPDPALRGVRLTKEEPFEWMGADGLKNVGGLLRPETAANARAVPLVIQAYEYQPKVFSPDGPDQQTYAAQTLVARGIAVLNINIPGEVFLEPEVQNSVKELTDFASEVSSAVGTLADRGQIDPTRVGLIGFSRAGYLSYYAITHPGQIPLAAAIVDDAFPGTYGYYLLAQIPRRAGDATEKNFEGPYGGSFWQNKTAWLEREPTFNVDRVQTPALFTFHQQSQIAYGLDTIGAFWRNDRPLEFLTFPEGHSHSLEMPRERLASLEASVDWMAFWLQGVAPADPERAKRWSAMKDDWERTRAAGVAQHSQDRNGSSKTSSSERGH